MGKLVKDYRDYQATRSSVACIGNFDGLHRGHKMVLEQCLRLSKSYGADALAFSFSPHPRHFLLGSDQPPLLMTDEEKIESLSRMGMDAILLQSFDQNFSENSAEYFRDEILGRWLDCRAVIVGRDFRFGFRAHGDIESLQQQNCFEVILVEASSYKGRAISSSWIRDCLMRAELELANELLGHPYFLSGSIIRGDGRGRRLGIPTANVRPTRLPILPSAVYMAWVEVVGEARPQEALVNIGIRPTFEAGYSIEFHVLNSEKNLYDKNIRIHFIKKIRDEIKFMDGTGLVAQIKNDIAAASHAFQNLNFLHSQLMPMQKI